MLRSPLFATGALMYVLTIPPLLWLNRVPPEGDACSPAPTAARSAWAAGLEPIAFGAGCAVVLLLLWASSRGGAQRPSTADRVGGALALALGAQWWAAGEDSIAGWIAIFSFLAIYPMVVVAPATYAGLLWAVAGGRPVLAWQLLRALCWCSIVVLIPFFVALISDWGGGGLCMS
jgi:hypothetical protein